MNDPIEQSAAYLDALTTLNRSLSHDLRSTLGNLSLHVGLLGEVVNREGDPDERRTNCERYMSRITDDVQRVVAAIDRVMKLTRPTREDAAAFDLRAAIVDVETVLASYARERRLEATWTLPSDPVTAAGPRHAVDRRVITHLVQTMRTTPEGGRIGVTLEAAPGHAVLRTESGASRGAPRVEAIEIPVAPAG